MPSRRPKSRITGLAASAGLFLAHGTAAAGLDGSSNVAIYWGQNSYDQASGPLAQQRLADYCANTDIDIIPMAFLVQITSGEGGQPVVNFANQGNNCTLFTGTELLNCPQIGDDIKTCQQKYNKTILLSIGGATYTEGGFESKDAAIAAANLVWDTFGPASGSALTASSTASAASSTNSAPSSATDASAIAGISSNASTTVAPVLSATLGNNLTTSLIAANLSTSTNTDPFAWTGDAEVLTISTEFVTTFTSFFSEIKATAAAQTSKISSKDVKSVKAATATDSSSTSDDGTTTAAGDATTTTAADNASPTTSDATSALSSTTAVASEATTSTTAASDASPTTTSDAATSTSDDSSSATTTSAAGADATTESTTAIATDATATSTASDAKSSNSVAQEETLSYDTTHIHRRTTALRPFGDAVLDGFDLDLETSVQNFNPFATRLRSLMDADTSKKYYLTAAPQCPYPDAADGSMLNGADGEPAVSFDAIWVQFYNNYCGVQSFTPNSTTQNNFNFDTWHTWATTVSANKNVKVFVGVPAGQTAAGSGYTPPASLDPIVAYCKTFSSFGGIMAWDASQAYANTGFLNGVKSALGSAASTTNSSDSSKRAARRIVRKEWWG